MSSLSSACIEKLVQWAHEDLLSAYDMLCLALHWHEYTEWQITDEAFCAKLVPTWGVPTMFFFAAQDEKALAKIICAYPQVTPSVICGPDNLAHQLLRQQFAGATTRHHLLYCYLRPTVPITGSGVIRITAAQAERYGFKDWNWPAIHGHKAQNQPIHCILRDGRWAATASLGHITPLTEEVRAVCTDESYRRQGLARAVVASATRSILAAGRLPVYVTEESNLPSRGLAEAVGYTQVGRLLRWEVNCKDE
jgi:hypothetical protein